MAPPSKCEGRDGSEGHGTALNVQSVKIIRAISYEVSSSDPTGHLASVRAIAFLICSTVGDSEPK